MIRHVVLFRFRFEVSSDHIVIVNRLLTDIRRNFLDMLDVQSGFLTCDLGRNQSFNWGLTVNFRSQADIDCYCIHPGH